MRACVVLIALISVGNFCVADGPKLIKLRASDIEKLPVLGILDFAEPRVEFSLDDKLVGENTKAVVRLRNSGTSPVVIKKITTSCGCTSAIRSKDEPIAPGSEERMLVSVDVKKPGKYGVQLAVYHGDDKSLVLLHGRGLSPIALVNKTAYPQHAKVVVELDVNDKSIDPRAVEVEGGVVKKVEDRVLTVEYSRVMPSTLRLPVVLRVPDRELDPLVVQLKRVKPSAFPTRPKLEGKKFKVWVLADPSEDHALEVYCQDRRLNASTDVQKFNGALYVTFEILEKVVPKRLEVAVDGIRTPIHPVRGDDS